MNSADTPSAPYYFCHSHLPLPVHTIPQLPNARPTTLPLRAVPHLPHATTYRLPHCYQHLTRAATAFVVAGLWRGFVPARDTPPPPLHYLPAYRLPRTARLPATRTHRRDLPIWTRHSSCRMVPTPWLFAANSTGFTCQLSRNAYWVHSLDTCNSGALVLTNSDGRMCAAVWFHC